MNMTKSTSTTSAATGRHFAVAGTACAVPRRRADAVLREVCERHAVSLPLIREGLRLAAVAAARREAAYRLRHESNASRARIAELLNTSPDNVRILIAAYRPGPIGIRRTPSRWRDEVVRLVGALSRIEAMAGTARPDIAAEAATALRRTALVRPVTPRP